jgi:2-methylcitrate dehydratase PrpD
MSGVTAVTTDREPADAAEVLASLVARTTVADLPKGTLSKARLDLLDTLGCAIAGENADGVAEARHLLFEWGGSEQSAVWGSGRLLPPPAAAFANAMSGHALDYDDQHPGISHTGVSVIPAAIATAESQGTDSVSDLLVAIVVGTEVADRLVLATTDGPGTTGWLLTPLCGFFGAAASAAKILRLTEAGTRHALGFAYVQASGNGQSTLDGALAKRMQPGFASRGGVFAAFLASRGLTAPVNSLEGVRGFYRVYHKNRYEPARLHAPRGENWLIDGATFKPYPCCAWTHAALECGAAFREQSLTPGDIEAVDIGVNAQAYASAGTALPRRYQPRTPVDAQFSIPYTFAAAFTAGTVQLSDFSESALRRPEVLDVAKRVRVHVDPEIDASHGRDVTPARATVRLKNGDTVEVRVWEPRGIGKRPLEAGDVLAKFTQCCRYAGRSAEFTGQVAELVLTAEESRAGELFGLLRGKA